MVVLILVTAAVLSFVIAGFLVGFRVGGRVTESELQRTRFAAARAERQLHDLTRSAFVAMAEHAERRQGDR